MVHMGRQQLAATWSHQLYLLDLTESVAFNRDMTAEKRFVNIVF